MFSVAHIIHATNSILERSKHQASLDDGEELSAIEVAESGAAKCRVSCNPQTWLNCSLTRLGLEYYQTCDRRCRTVSK